MYVYCETHLINDNALEVDVYTWYGHNRGYKHVHAPKGSGGVGMLVNNQSFTVSIIDKAVEGIMGILLVNKSNDRSIAGFVYRI